MLAQRQSGLRPQKWPLEVEHMYVYIMTCLPDISQVSIMENMDI